MKRAQMDATVQDTTAIPSTVRNFPGREIPTRSWDEWFLRHGIKQMTGAKVSHTEWSKTVVGLIASIVVLIGVIVSLVWWGATLSSELRYAQKDVEELKSEWKTFQQTQTQQEMEKIRRESEARGYQLKASEGAHGKDNK